ncbi:hypothetical protein GBAR_LOCUS29249 [Geodia barretti]|uniref:Uncharacterized protein n=1 Tax=Geodia barretti TaxID=519541 RepID=A0AA35TS82_GEOBA|nr:hypothetical protein GBAR_LOCUS29249 [Geodia barretti]
MDVRDRWGDREYSSGDSLQQDAPPIPIRPPAGMRISPYAMDPAYLPQVVDTRDTVDRSFCSRWRPGERAGTRRCLTEQEAPT